MNRFILFKKFQENPSKQVLLNLNTVHTIKYSPHRIDFYYRNFLESGYYGIVKSETDSQQEFDFAYQKLLKEMQVIDIYNVFNPKKD
jgi:hypothetical protein